METRINKQIKAYYILYQHNQYSVLNTANSNAVIFLQIKNYVVSLVEMVLNTLSMCLITNTPMLNTSVNTTETAHFINQACRCHSSPPHGSTYNM